jgi:hypothetical protein
VIPEAPRAWAAACGALLLLLGGGVARAADDAPAEPPPPADGGDAPEEDDGAPPEEEPDPLHRYRTPFPVLTERVLGTASRPIEFDWRRTKVHLGASGAQLYELNNFDSLRAGAVARFPSDNLLYEVGLGWVFVQDTPSSQLIALTPYRQAGRPRRVALDFNVGIPLAEGVVTTAPRWFPAVEQVFMAYAGVRYAWYPGAAEGLRFRDRVGNAVNPRVSREERQNLDEERLDAMRVDNARYHTMIGFGDDIYFRQGVFVNPRASMAVPLISSIAGSNLLWWGEFSLSIGVAL